MNFKMVRIYFIYNEYEEKKDLCKSDSFNKLILLSIAFS